MLRAWPCKVLSMFGNSSCCSTLSTGPFLLKEMVALWTEAAWSSLTSQIFWKRHKLLLAFAMLRSLETFLLNNIKSNSNLCNIAHPYHQHQLKKTFTDSRLTRTFPKAGILRAKELKNNDYWSQQVCLLLQDVCVCWTGTRGEELQLLSLYLYWYLSESLPKLHWQIKSCSVWGVIY